MAEPGMVFDVFTIDLDFGARRRFAWLNCLGFGHFYKISWV